LTGSYNNIINRAISNKFDELEGKLDADVERAIKRLDERIRGKQSSIQMLIAHYKTLKANQDKLNEMIIGLKMRISVLEKGTPNIDYGQPMDKDEFYESPPWN
jgi:chromosome segregation ATPase